MNYNYFKSALVTLRIYKINSIISILGLVLAISAISIIFSYARLELSFDSFHDDVENIYRAESIFSEGKEITDDWATSSFGYAHAMKEEFPEIVEYTRINLLDTERVVEYQNKKYREKKVCLVDSTFFSIFSYPLIQGNPKTVLSKPNSVVISEFAAKKYFGKEDPIGKFLKISTRQNTFNCEITGIIKDLPYNSNLQFNFLISWATYSPDWLNNTWYWHEVYTYLKLIPDADVQGIESKFPALAERYKTEDALKNKTWGITLTPLKKIHLNKQKPYERELKGNRNSIIFLSIAVVIALFIALFNFINLSVTQTLRRQKEIGLKKTMGALKAHFFKQSIVETSIIFVVSFIICVLLVWLIVPFFNDLFDCKLQPFSNANIIIWGFVLLITLSGIIISSIVPNIVINGINPEQALKSRITDTTSSRAVRKAIIAFQFICAFLLISILLVISKQISFMENSNLGVETNDVLLIKYPVKTDKFNQKVFSFKNDLLSKPFIENVCNSNSIAGQKIECYLSNKRTDTHVEENRLYEMLRVDQDYIPLYNLKILAGRNFFDDHNKEKQEVIINETALKSLRFTNPEEAIDKFVLLEGNDKKHKIIGVIKDYHHNSLHKSHNPIMLFKNSQRHDWITFKYFSIKLIPGNGKKELETVKKTWENFFPNSTFDYYFLNDSLNELYKADMKFSLIFLIFSILSIIISCFGLWGQSMQNILRRTKEIGIRKVLGTPNSLLFIVIQKEIYILIGISILIALPLSYILITNWLNNYAFKTQITFLQLILPAILIFVFSSLTIMPHIIKSMKTDPSNILRGE